MWRLRLSERRVSECYAKKIRHYLKDEHKVNENKISSFCKDICKNVITKNEKVAIHYVKLTYPLSFKTRFPKNIPTHRRQAVNPRTISWKARNSPVKYHSRESEHDTNESEDNVLKENVQGQKHQGRCVEPELPSHRKPKCLVQN